MVEVYSEVLDKTIAVNRLIGKIEGHFEGPTIVFFSGIHGNETAGVFALEHLFNVIKPEDVKGTICGISGNLKALADNKRFIKKDLNRIWTEEYLDSINSKSQNKEFEHKEQLELFELLKDILKEQDKPIYFIDFHTTSSKTAPFITINDALINRKFSKQFPVPIVLGIEEYLSGPLLSYINELGYVSLGFESGQHNAFDAVSNCKAFIFLALEFTNVIDSKKIPMASSYYEQLKTASKKTKGFFEIIDLHPIMPQDSFKMLNGFENFQSVRKGTPLAVGNNKIIKSKYNAKMFMPLYQPQGEEGFFIIRKIRPFFLKLSALLRKLKADELLVILPGISWKDSEKHILFVNLKTARFMAKSIFHLLGYRSKQVDETHLKLYNRERAAKTHIYVQEPWYKIPN